LFILKLLHIKLLLFINLLSPVLFRMNKHY